MNKTGMKTNNKLINPHGDHYNDDEFNYERYWDSRKYEHLAEVSTIIELLGDEKFLNAVDIGGGYGRLTVVLEKFSEQATLLESSQKQLDIAKEFMKDHPNIRIIKNTAQELGLDDESVDLAIMVRVMHHFPEPREALERIAKSIKKNGVFILEFANQTHLKNRIKNIGKPFSKDPVSVLNFDDNSIPFVNHHPETVIKLVEELGFVVEKKLSVSMFRSSTIKKLIPADTLSKLDGLIRPFVSPFDLGPSVFLKLRKK